jgi:hypothetical protein
MTLPVVEMCGIEMLDIGMSLVEMDGMLRCGRYGHGKTARACGRPCPEFTAIPCRGYAARRRYPCCAAMVNGQPMRAHRLRRSESKR